MLGTQELIGKYTKEVGIAGIEWEKKQWLYNRIQELVSGEGDEPINNDNCQYDDCGNEPLIQAVLRHDGTAMTYNNKQ